MLYVVDTHPLVWFLLDNDNLSEEAKKVFEGAEKEVNVLVIPTIVIAELLYISIKKGIEDKFYKLIEMIKNGTNYVTYNLDLEVILECKNITEIHEMHDKIIVSTARILKTPIITKDKEIIDSKYVKTIW